MAGKEKVCSQLYQPIIAWNTKRCRRKRWYPRKRKQPTTTKAKIVVDRLSTVSYNVEHCNEGSGTIYGEFVMPAAYVGSVQNTWIAPNSSQYPIYAGNHPAMLPSPLSPYPVAMPCLNAWTSSPSRSSTMVSSYPFTLKMLTSCIRVCQSCRIPFSDNMEPPYDLVILRSNSQYHVSLHCITAAEPSFLPSELIIPEDVLGHLTDIHRGFLYASLGIHV